MHTLIGHGLSDPERQAEFSEINPKLTAEKSEEHTGYVPTTCSKLSDEAAVEIAQVIVDLNPRLSMNRIWALEDEIEKQKQR